MGTKKMQRFDTPVRIRVMHFRRRLCDPDGLNAKAFIDGIVKAGILADDSAKEITEVAHRQFEISKDEDEKTVIEIVDD